MSDGERDVVDFDAGAVLEAARSAVGERSLFTCVVYDDADFETVYVDDRIRAIYEDDASREEHFGQIHSYVHLDFTEMELFRELFREPGRIRAFVTYMDAFVAVRVVAEKQGVFLSVSPNAPVTDLVDAVEDAIER